jgi:hypothetical protein
MHSADRSLATGGLKAQFRISPFLCRKALTPGGREKVLAYSVQDDSITLSNNIAASPDANS